MKVLVLSDSHSGLSFARWCIDRAKPDALIHLGDYFDDGQTIAESYPWIPMYQVCGNCDRYRCPPFAREILIMPVGGADLYMTHGHLQKVKQTLGLLIRDARESHVSAVLYGHTHVADCHREEDGLWVLNPGSCGSWGGSVGQIIIDKGNIVDCRILRQEDLEAME